jgi:hypothetical protein
MLCYWTSVRATLHSCWTVLLWPEFENACDVCAGQVWAAAERRCRCGAAAAADARAAARRRHAPGPPVRAGLVGPCDCIPERWASPCHTHMLATIKQPRRIPFPLRQLSQLHCAPAVQCWCSSACIAATGLLQMTGLAVLLYPAEFRCISIPHHS